MRVWHLIDACGPQATCTTLALLGQSLSRLGDVDQEVLLLGGAALRKRAEDAGVRSARTMGVPFGRGAAGFFAVQRLARRLGPFDLVHCWSPGTMALAAAALRRVPRLLTLSFAPTSAQVRWMRAVMAAVAGSPTVLLPTSATIRRLLLSRGLPEQAVHVLRPGLDMGRVAHGRRDQLREQWGLTRPQLTVVALLSDQPQAANAMDAAMATALADPDPQASGPGACLLVHPDARHERRARRIMAEVGRRDSYVADARLERPWLVLPGCDAALVQTDGGLSLLWAMASNVPIVGEATYAVSEIVEDRHSALLAKPGAPKYLAHRLTQLMEDRQLAWQLRDTARHEAYSFFSRQRYCQSLAAVYEQMAAGREVEVPALESTGGLRFAGRG